MSFFDDPNVEKRIPTLISRMMTLHQAVGKTITTKDLGIISELSEVELQSKSEDLIADRLDISDSPNKELKKLYDLLKKVDDLAIQDATPLIDGLKRFDSEHGEYLPLAPLAVGNLQTLSLSLNDFATFYTVFVKHMSYTKKGGELGDTYTIDFDTLNARSDWFKWQHTRSARISFDPDKAGYPGIFEKFLAGRLKKDEWLSDLDIQRELNILGLQEQVHIVPFKEDDIGLVLHFEREKHQLDDPKKEYTIPLIVNLGEDGHSRIDSRGVHWTRMLIKVDPTQSPTQITVDYKDGLFLAEASKKAIEKTIRNALKYRTQLGGYNPDEQLKVYTAFPDCEAPTINITGSGEQRDGFTCGYRALKGIVSDLLENEVIEDNETYQKFLACEDSTSLRNFVYRSLLGEQSITNATKAGIIKAMDVDIFKETSEASSKFVVKPALVEGQLLAFSHPSTVKKEGKKGKFNGELLEKLVVLNEKVASLQKLEVIKNIAISTTEPLELDLNEIIEEVKRQNSDLASDPALVYQVIFDQVAKNSALKTLKLAGTEKIDTKILQEKIDGLPFHIKLISDELNLKQYLEIINSRNSLLKAREVTVPEGSDPWDSLLENILFTPPPAPSGTTFEWMNQDNVSSGQNDAKIIGAIVFAKLLQYMVTHKDRFIEEFPFDEFNLTLLSDEKDSIYSNLGMLSTLKEHLQSQEPFTPFTKFLFHIPEMSKIDKEKLVEELTGILKAMKSPPIERLTIKTDSFDTLSKETIDALIKIVQANNYPTVISFSASKTPSPEIQLKLQELENAGLLNQRKGLTQTTVASSPSPKSKGPVVLGKIGKAILKTEGLEGLDTEVQIQEQQQQQVQQQVQTALDDEELPEEDEIHEEVLTPYTSKEKLFTRDTIYQLYPFSSKRHLHLEPTQCWDMITGENAGLFKYGIKKMTASAAKVLIEHLQDVQYGLHPDNLPRGFSLQQDSSGDMVLAYNANNPTINPNESPLTIRFSKPLAANQWLGNIIQFMSQEQAASLYKSVIEAMKEPRPTLEACISNFFFLKEDPKGITLSNSQRVSILNGLIERMTTKEEASAIQKQIRDLFGEKLSLSNIKALSEILYQQGPQALAKLLEDFNQIKTVKGEKFFASFKTCFIDPSQNLNELTTVSAHASMQKLLTLSAAQTTWWVSLTEQHSSNLKYNPEPSGESIDGFTVVSGQAAGQRWANLAELTEGFLYFCGQLDEVSPGLNLTEYCPLTDVADMRVALDRLLTTILPNAHNVDEQFYEGLKGLSLDPLGPFYASRYEGFKLVTSDMMLNLSDSYSKSTKTNKQYAEENFCFRSDKEGIGANLVATTTDSLEKRRSIFMRYIATFNHRAALSQYAKAFEQISNIPISDDDTGMIDHLIVIVASFGTGKRAKSFTQGDMDNLIKWVTEYEPDSNEYSSLRTIFSAWRGIRNAPIRPTLNEIVDISKLAFSSKSPRIFMSHASNLIARYGDHAEGYLEALLLLSKNKQSLDAGIFQDILHQTEGLNDSLDKPKAEFDLDPKIKVATVKLLAVCKSEGVTESNALNKVRELYTEVDKCLKEHGPQTTNDLLELLGHIDVEGSEDLPTLDVLINLVKTVAENAKPNYTDLERTVKSALPETCVIQMEKVTATPVEPPGNLYTIITKYMGEIREQLADNKSQIDMALGEGFYDSLASPEGTRRLLDGLAKISDLSGLIGGIAQGKIQGVMLKVYESVTNDGIERIGIKDVETKGRIAKIINNKINHPIKKESDFAQFTKSYAGELQSLSQLLGNLQTINKTWPKQFKSVLDALDDSPRLNAYPLSLLAGITGSFADNFNKSASFPTDLLRQFLGFADLNEKSITSLKSIVEQIFDPDKKDLFNDAEKRMLCELALRYCHDNADSPEKVSIYLENLFELQKPDGKLFAAKLKIVSGCEKVDGKSLTSMNEAFEVLSSLKNPALLTTALNFFSADKKRATGFASAIAKLSGLEAEKQVLIMTIAMKAAEKMSAENYQSKMLADVIDSLKTLSPEALKQLEALYRNPRHPDLSSLKSLLAEPSKVWDEKAFQELQAKYDRDYWLQGEEKFDRSFDTSKLAKYLDNLQDMNYERPMLLSQREELQRWFLYVNSIGNNRGVPTQPWKDDGGALKSFKEMSHGEIQGLLKHYREQLKKELSSEERLKIRLETIALLREVMYRGTGKFPRPTQILYLLTAMQSGQDFIAQIQTGQGKSMTAGLAAALANIEGKTVDICTSSLFLASDGLKENKDFFEYLGIKAKLIHATSGKEDYEEGAIHYSSMSELALHRSKMQLLGKIFPKDCTLIADEVDFSTLDDSTRYRYATALDPVTDPYKSPYTWIYEALVQFADTQKGVKSDAEFMEQAKIWLRNSAKTKEQKAQLKDLEEQPDVYKKRLETWLVAAGKTSQLIDLQNVKYRIVTLEHPTGQVSKACILTGARPNIQAEFSDAIQQFLHVRLRQKYQSEIDQGKMPDFLVEPEKTYITTLNSKILLNTYKQRMGMTGTAGSKEEVKEQYAKYGFRFVDIPPFTESKRQDLQPILTNPKLVTKPEEESLDHINRIVKETLAYISKQKGGMAGPILIHCADKDQGEEIYKALEAEIRKNPKKYQSKFQGVDTGIQRFYSSEKSKPEERNKEEEEIKEKAGLNGMITISTVFGRGTDIKPKHDNGLYTIDTFVDTDPYSSEDLERSKQQKVGRSGRAGQVGFTRLIARRSEFADIYSTKQMQQIPETLEGIEQATSKLNHVRNEQRMVERELRESFDDVKDILYQEFFKFIQVINTSEENIPKKAIRDQVTKQWNLVLSRIDNRWDELQHDPKYQNMSHKEKLKAKLIIISQFACEQWNDLAKEDGVLRTNLTSWANYNKLTLSQSLALPAVEPLVPENVVDSVITRRPHLERFYVKRMQQYGKVDPNVSEAAVYSDFMSTSKHFADKVSEVRVEATQSYIQNQAEWLSTPAHRQKLGGKFNITPNDYSPKNVEQIMGGLLYLRYKAYRDGNPVAYARLNKECHRFENQMLWSKNDELIAAVVRAQQAHFKALTSHRGKNEAQKGTYLNVFMAEGRKQLPEQTSKWKKEGFATWWSGDSGQGLPGMKTQAMDWLRAYKDNWWSRGWVSNDRKTVVANLLLHLEMENQKPQDILCYIAAARQQLLEDDQKNSRSLKSSVQGRLYQYLDELELKVQAAMAPDELDVNTHNMLDNVKIVLKQALDLGINSKELREVVNVLNTTATPQTKYQALCVFFNNLSSMEKAKGIDNDNWESLKTYCQQAKLQMVRYFAQCDTNTSFNEQRSTQVYQAASQAAAAHFQRVMDRDIQPKLNLPPKEGFTYRERQITFNLNHDVINKGVTSPLFKKINQVPTYRELLASLEKSIVENSAHDAQVQFKAIHLDSSKGHYPDGEGFMLRVSMNIDGVPAHIDYHINMKTGEMYCNDHDLQELNKPRRKEPELGEFTLDQTLDAIAHDWEQIKSKSKQVASETRAKMLSVDERIAQIKEHPELSGESPTHAEKYRKLVQEITTEGQEFREPKIK